MRINPDTSETTFDERTYAWDDAGNKTQRVKLVGGNPVKTYDYEYDALNRLWRSTKSLAAPAGGTPASWSGAMTLGGVSPSSVPFTGGAVSLTGDFSATYDPGTLGVYITEVQGTGILQQDYPAEILSAASGQIDILAPPRGEQGTFDIYASALDGVTPVNSNPISFSYGPLVTEYDLDGAGNRVEVERGGETEGYTLDGSSPDPADADVNQYTQTPQDVAPRQYDENGNHQHTGAALPTSYRQSTSTATSKPSARKRYLERLWRRSPPHEIYTCFLPLMHSRQEHLGTEFPSDAHFVHMGTETPME